MTAILVLTTVSASFDAAALATQLVDGRLAACINIIPRVRSIYRWQEKVEDDGEQLLIIKTTSDRVDALRDALFAKHPYDVPEFVAITIDRIDGPYREWLANAVR